MSRELVAFSTQNNRIAPVFDTSTEITVVTVEDNAIMARERVELTQSNFFELVEKFVELKLRRLVCGAISKIIQAQLELKGIAVQPFIAGEIEEVIQMWLKNELNREEYLMPGCCRRQRRGKGQGFGRINADGRNGVRLGRQAGMGWGCAEGFRMGTKYSSSHGLGRGLGRGAGLGLGFRQNLEDRDDTDPTDTEKQE